MNINIEINETLEQFLVEKKVLKQFVLNAIKNYWRTEYPNVVLPIYSITTAFTWKDTPEGHNFWSKLVEEYVSYSAELKKGKVVKNTPNLLECAGRGFTCKIDGTFVEGKIQVEDNSVFLCQNIINGYHCKDTLGYYYSWAPKLTKDGQLHSESSVTEFELLPESTTKVYVLPTLPENLLNYAGYKFTCDIDGTKDIEGEIQVEKDRVFLCQNSKNGVSADNKRGYKYSWGVDRGTADDLKQTDVSNLKLYLNNIDVDTYKDWRVGDKIVYKGEDRAEIIFCSGELVVYKFKGKGGEIASFNRTCDELYNEGWRLDL